MFRSTIMPFEHGLPSKTKTHASSSQFTVSVSISNSLRVPSLSTSVCFVVTKTPLRHVPSPMSKILIRSSRCSRCIKFCELRQPFQVNVPCYIFTSLFYQRSVISHVFEHRQSQRLVIILLFYVHLSSRCGLLIWLEKLIIFGDGYDKIRCVPGNKWNQYRDLDIGCAATSLSITVRGGFWKRIKTSSL